MKKWLSVLLPILGLGGAVAITAPLIVSCSSENASGFISEYNELSADYQKIFTDTDYKNAVGLFQLLDGNNSGEIKDASGNTIKPVNVKNIKLNTFTFAGNLIQLEVTKEVKQNDIWVVEQTKEFFSLLVGPQKIEYEKTVITNGSEKKEPKKIITIDEFKKIFKDWSKTAVDDIFKSKNIIWTW